MVVEPLLDTLYDGFVLPTPNATLLPSGTLGFDEAIPAGSRPVRAQGFTGLFIRKR